MDLMDRELAISARALDDLCALAELAANIRAKETHNEDSLTRSLRGAVREVRCRAQLLSPDTLV